MTGQCVTGMMPHRRRPCAECPWRRDAEPGQFPAHRYEVLRDTSEQAAGQEPGFFAPLFACHKSPEGREEACAGWLAAVGHRHLGVRLAVAQRRLPPHVLTPGEGWPALFDTYAEMAAVQGGEDR
ncbi:DUF6283 family protein [Actinacidiphila sp. ITFR-21]|uniref:DUF6283 family protein n=1 Tax=Actinacidiphila sp. ITFR-21 TaxID=3075199 RepID=UPI0028895B6B|nr:DUF6283 family protein [Streptomyces sp. ITFR-21]WNI20340.1 DUF6283 family protein [Streptomyces sp. ITFR-21]